MAALVKLLEECSALGRKALNCGERPSKRRKSSSSGPPDAICIARERIQFPALLAVDERNANIAAKNAGEHLCISVAENPGSRLREWVVTVSSRKGAGAFVRQLFKSSALSSQQVAALAVVTAQGVRSSDDGCLWAVLDATIQQDGKSVHLGLSIQVNWNPSRSIWCEAQSSKKPQQALRENHLRSWYPKLPARLFASQEMPATPQDFYESAFVPDKEEFADVLAMDVPGLETKLYPFQRRAVQWLLQREGVQWRPGSDQGSAQLVPFATSHKELLVSFAEVEDADGGRFFMSPALGAAVRNLDIFRASQYLRGGIVAEEMGLGKTLEVIALMLLHRRSEGPIMIPDPFLGRELLSTSATLIVTPATLLDQWLSELHRHAPTARILHYPGLKKAPKGPHEVQLSAEYLGDHDVVITTYDVLRAEIWIATDEPQRSMRNPKQYERPVTPLVQLSWWRVCIDEAQMVENWASNAAKLARLIPRVNAWAITGTPVKDDVQKDFRGLLNFLRYEPFASDSKIWSSFATRYKECFREIIKSISIRHTKSLVRSEISIPPQKRYVITMPFTAVEEQHYQNLFELLAGTCGLDVHGNPTRDDWNPEDPAVQSVMRSALDSLRRTALHPGVGGHSRKVGQKAPMRTLTEVLDAMLDQSDSARRTDQRNLLALRITKGQILAGLDKVKEALRIWEDVKEKSTIIVSQCRQELERETKDAREKDVGESHQSSDDNENSEDSVPPRVGEARRRLRHALEIQHRAVFFCANAYFSIKSNKAMTAPESEEYKQLEKRETEHYDLAKAIRKEILQESHGKAKKLMDGLVADAENQSFVVIPESQPAGKSGIESRKIAEAFEEICGALDEQANQLDEWREHVIQLLIKPLVDEETDDITGEEYEQSTREQDEILVFVQALRAAISDRLTAVSGQKNFLVGHETKVARKFAEEGNGPSPEKLLELLDVRDQIRPPFDEKDSLSSLKGVVSELRSLIVTLKNHGSNNTRTVNELGLVQNLFKQTQSQNTAQWKAATAMEHETERFTDTLNARLDFYRQLQAVSDTVTDYDGSIDAGALEQAAKSEDALQKKLATTESKHRYLVHLKDTEANSDEQRICVICQSPFTIGVLTVCGHQFCKECITFWFRAHHNCPVCKRHLDQSNLHDITLKPQVLTVHDERDNEQLHDSQRTPTKKTSIYSEFNPEKLAEIKNIDLKGPHFTTKVDTLVRHLLWLRESDPGAKSIVFSQYKDFLDVLREAFSRYRIGHTSFDRANGITQFKEDPAIEVFLLHARAHASGLNLVNASHVFLCEPLLHTALELQAIARVDRIGQQQETTVWLYIVAGTVEESIYNLSVHRRMEHMGRKLKGKSKESTPELLGADLDAANALEMQQAQLSKLMGRDGEVVDSGDLWTCLFGHVKAEQSGEHRRLVENPATRGFLSAEAAEARRMA